MGQQPAKFFPWPTPYGQSPDPNVVTQAQAPEAAPVPNLLPLNAPDPSQAQAQAPASPYQTPYQPGYGGQGFYRNRRSFADSSSY